MDDMTLLGHVVSGVGFAAALVLIAAGVVFLARGRGGNG